MSHNYRPALAQMTPSEQSRIMSDVADFLTNKGFFDEGSLLSRSARRLQPRQAYSPTSKVVYGALGATQSLPAIVPTTPLDQLARSAQFQVVFDIAYVLGQTGDYGTSLTLLQWLAKENPSETYVFEIVQCQFLMGQDREALQAITDEGSMDPGLQQMVVDAATVHIHFADAWEAAKEILPQDIFILCCKRLFRDERERNRTPSTSCHQVYARFQAEQLNWPAAKEHLEIALQALGTNDPAKTAELQQELDHVEQQLRQSRP